jgi:hypothetical protein
MADPRGGVRHVIPEKGNYRKDIDKKINGNYSTRELVEATNNILEEQWKNL